MHSCIAGVTTVQQGTSSAKPVIGNTIEVLEHLVSPGSHSQPTSLLLPGIMTYCCVVLFSEFFHGH